MAEGESERMILSRLMEGNAYHRHVVMMTSLLQLHSVVWRTDRLLYEDSITSNNIIIQYKRSLDSSRSVQAVEDIVKSGCVRPSLYWFNFPRARNLKSRSERGEMDSP